MVSPNESEAFSRVGRALSACWTRWHAADAGAGPPASPIGQRQRNELLDETGSDFRPLVDLLLDLGPVICSALAAGGLRPLSVRDWDTARAPLVHRVVSTRYLQPDVVRWAVDVWGRALGVSPLAVVAAPVTAPLQAGLYHDAPAQEAPMRAALSRDALSRAAPPSATRSAVALPLGALPATKAAVPNAPSWAGGPVALGVGARVSPSARQSLAASGRLVRGPVRAAGPRFAPVERLAGAILLGLLVVVAVSLQVALSRRPPASRPSVVQTRPVATPQTPVKAAEPVGEASAEVMVSDALMQAHSGLLTPPSAWLRQRGVAGRYRVTQRIVSVDGSTSCTAVAAALGVGRTSDEPISHAPGSTTFRLDARGVAGTLSEDGAFVAGPVSGTQNNIPWVFRMRGRFLPDGFTGESQTFTQAIIRWGRTQSCVVTATLDATRLPG